MVLQELGDFFGRHVVGASRGRGSPSHLCTLGRLTLLLPPVRLSLRSYWHNVSAKSRYARRDRRLHLSLTLCWGLLQKGAFPGGRRLLLARVVNLPQRITLPVVRGRHAVLLRRRDVMRARIGGLRSLALLVVSGKRIRLGLQRRRRG